MIEATPLKPASILKTSSHFLGSFYFLNQDEGNTRPHGRVPLLAADRVAGLHRPLALQPGLRRLRAQLSYPPFGPIRNIRQQIRLQVGRHLDRGSNGGRGQHQLAEEDRHSQVAR